MEVSTDTPESNQSSSHSRRLWYVFGVSGLLIVFLVGSIVWLPWHRQIQAIEEFKRLDGYIDTIPTVRGWLRDLVGEETMRGFDDVTYLVLIVDEGSDPDLAHLKWMTRMRGLTFYGPEASDADLTHLKRMKRLDSLAFNGSKVTDAGLVHLEGLTNLFMLKLVDTQVTDAGLEHLKAMTSLEELWLHGTQATHAGMNDLQTSLPLCTIHRFSYRDD
jgi:hypothetical protein